ncbi:hypothetical protein AB5J56_04195 [Streptomyces sp. R21]|uniref:Uncharacterized protein n=1 Tax=Streptomyces sp. R21 TaxID=3238627 RepID=A0AB39P2E3_9ACTN
MPWTQAEGLRRLAFAVRPWILIGRSAADLAADLSVWRVPRRPASPAALIMARWREDGDQAPAVGAPPCREATPSGVPPNRDVLDAKDALRTRLQHLPSTVEPVPDQPAVPSAQCLTAWLPDLPIDPPHAGFCPT